VNTRSIRVRLTAWYAAILAATLAIAGIGVWLALRESIHITVDKELRSRAQAMREFLRQAEESHEDSIDELMEDASLGPAGLAFRLADPSGRWLYQSRATTDWRTASVIPAQLPPRGRFETTAHRGRPVRVISARVPMGAVQIGVPLDEFEEMLNGFAWSALLASPLLLLLASAGGYVMSRRALAPVEQISRSASSIEAQNLSQRLPLSGADDELDRLSTTLNAMLERLENSFRRTTQFTADASHELRTPLAIMRTTAEVVRRRPRAEAEYCQALDRIVAECERTTRMVEDLMTLARADTGSRTAVRETVDLAGLLRAACADAGPLAQSAGITLSEGPMDCCTVQADAAALRRLVLILLDNAIKYSQPRGCIEVLLAKAGDKAVLEVRDYGIGIPAEDLPHVFERFYRASKDRSRKIDGVGLGLSIARSIATEHGGAIAIASTPGRGTTVRVTLAVD